MFWKKNQRGNIVTMIPGDTTKQVTEAGIQETLGEYGTDNLIINGGFDFWQRGTSGQAGANAGEYVSADRWKLYSIRQGVSVSGGYLNQDTTSPSSNSKYAGKLNSNSEGRLHLRQPQELQLLQGLIG